MISFAIPAFNEPHFTDHMANKQCRVVNITEVTQDTFFAYNRLFEENGLSQKECRQNGQHYFAAYAGENVGVFLNFFASLASASRHKSHRFIWKITACPMLSACRMAA